MRTIETFNANWFFSKENIIPTEVPDHWQTLDLPHTWNNIDGQDGGNDYYRGTCVYAKTFSKPSMETDGKAYLEFAGVAMTANVYLNGQHLGEHKGGYSTFRLDLTPALQEENLLVVTADNSDNDSVYPQKADFTFYGGIYRDVKLICLPENHFELIKDGTPGIKATPIIENNKGHLTVETWQTGSLIKYTLFDQDKTIVSTAIIASEKGYGKWTAQVENPNLWEGLSNPYLYTVQAELLNESNQVIDTVSTSIGFRSFAFDKDKGFILNGKPYPLRGVSRHQDFAEIGNAITYDIQVNDMELIKEIGANTIRLAHYQHSQEFYDLCDKEGMVIWAEIPYITKHMPNGRDNTISQMRELVTQCYNHPSIVCWGLSNEITATGKITDDLVENHQVLNDLCHQMDKTRPTSMAHVFMLEIDHPIVGLPDISSYNLYFGWYLGSLEQNDQFFDDFHTKYPDRIIGFSEYGADANPTFQTSNPEVGDYTEAYQALYHEHILECIEKRPYLWATHVWNMFDFAADGRDEGGSHGLNQKGLVSFDRKYKKDAFYLYKAHWSDEPFIHLCDKNYVERSESETSFKVYTNQDQVSIYLDGQLMESKQIDKKGSFSLTISGQHTIEIKSGNLSDSSFVKKVDEPNLSYRFAKEDIINWFDADDIDQTCFSINDTLGEISANPDSGAVLNAIMAKVKEKRGDVAKEATGNENLRKMMAGMSLKQLLKQAGDTVSKEQINQLNKSLQKIKK